MGKAVVSHSIVALVVLSTNVSAVTIDWTPVGNPGNATDPSTGSRFGAINYAYKIDKYDVTASQYVEFLNATDPSGANDLGLYNNQMSDELRGEIAYNPGAASSSKYSVMLGRDKHAANNVTFYDALRFANWLSNGQGNGDTENGSYRLEGRTPTPTNAASISRNPAATIFLPSENEWYKAAYYDPNASSYNLYPTGSSLIPHASGPTATPNSANYDGVENNVTDVGAYTGTTSPYGAYDMGGNVAQWNDTLISGDIPGLRGGDFYDSSVIMLPSNRGFANPTGWYDSIGFRVASAPEPSTLILAALGGVALLVRLKKVASIGRYNV